MDRSSDDLATLAVIWLDLDQERRDELLDQAQELYRAWLVEKNGKHHRRLMQGFMDLGYRASGLRAAWARFIPEHRAELDHRDGSNVIPFPQVQP